MEANAFALIWAFFMMMMIPVLIWAFFCILAMWKVFVKAGKPGIVSIIPIYNSIVLLEISGLPLWYFLLYFIPFVNIYAVAKQCYGLATNFGKDVGYAFGLFFLNPIFMMILAFGDAEYIA
jgi:hypothetical protein